MASRIAATTFLLLASLTATGQHAVANTQQTAQPPARDRAPARTGTAVIRGRVFASDTGRPLRRARISLSSEYGEGRTTNTNPDGRYEIRDLPAGRYSMTVTRGGYLALQYGQRRPLEQGKPLQLLDKQVMDNIDFSLPRMSLITGHVTDEVGEPISGVHVWVLRSAYFEGRRRLAFTGGTTTTDDTGQYRILNLVPGTYFVMGTMSETWSVSDGGVEQVLGFAATYFTGTTNVGDARRVTVSIGQEAANIDFSLIPGRAARISGTAIDSHGRPLAGSSVTLSQEFRGPGRTDTFSSGGAPVGADGTFTIKNVSSGDYKLYVRSTTDGKIPTTQITEAAAAPVSVNGIDIDNITLVTSPGWSLSGQVVDERGATPRLPRNAVGITTRPVSNDFDPFLRGGANNGGVKDDWTFAITGLFGPARLHASVTGGLTVKAIVHNGRDVSDAIFDLKSREELSGLQVVITNKSTTISGQLADDKGAPLIDGTVIVFADEAEKWYEGSRSVKSARPDQQGRYQIKGLPPGEYLAVALEYVQEGTWNDPEYLESIRRYGQKFTLGEGASQSLALKLTALEVR